MAWLTIAGLKNWAKRVAVGVAALVLVAVVAIVLLLRDRPALTELDLPPYPDAVTTPGLVTATWFGVTTLLFDDGDTQILIDGFMTRPSLADIVFDMPVESSAATINAVLNEYQMRRLAAIIPVHSHFDHAMDVGAIANRSSASILGSTTTVQIARGAGVPDDQIVLVASGEPYQFGDFTVTLIDSVHAPVGWGGSVPFDGRLERPLKTPAPVSAWLAGKSYSIVIAHPQGTTLVQGSGGFIEGSLDDVLANVVMLGVGGIEGLGRNYVEGYWQALVTATGATTVIPIHFDDYSRPFGEVHLFPRILDNFVVTAGWLREIRDIWDNDASLHLPEFGKPMVLYPPPAPEA